MSTSTNQTIDKQPSFQMDRRAVLIAGASLVAASALTGLWHSQELHAKALGPKELVLIDGATHMDLYDGPGAVAAAAKLAPFFQKNLDVEAAT